jgi:hypothetical protein
MDGGNKSCSLSRSLTHSAPPVTWAQPNSVQTRAPEFTNRRKERKTSPRPEEKRKKVKKKYFFHFKATQQQSKNLFEALLGWNMAFAVFFSCSSLDRSHSLPPLRLFCVYFDEGGFRGTVTAGEAKKARGEQRNFSFPTCTQCDNSRGEIRVIPLRTTTTTTIVSE